MKPAIDGLLLQNLGMKAAIPVALLLATAGGAGYFGNDLLAAAPAATTFATNSSCRIKGNISIDTGERIYHLPGQKFYEQTKISPEYGERWFCSEPKRVWRDGAGPSASAMMFSFG